MYLYYNVRTPVRYKAVSNVINFEKNKKNTLPLLPNRIRRAMNKRVTIVTMIMIASLCLSPLAIADENEDIPTNAQNTGVHDSLVAALSHANLVSTLQGDGPYTVFAPTDNAFLEAGIDLSTFDTDEENQTLVDILTYHVYSGSVDSSQVTDGMTATMLNGDDVAFTVAENGDILIGGATVTTADVISSNGIIHVIDKVLLPPQDITEEDGDICYNTVTHTVAAGASFEECTAYAYYENADFGGQTFTGCYNMVTHVADPTVSQEICEAYVWTPALDIPTTAQATTIHNSLVAALTQAQLVATLQGDGPFTVFAPTDNAFLEAGIDLSTFDTDEEIAMLVDILTYHVVPSQVPSSAVTDGLVAVAVNGDELTFTVSDSGVMVNDANVTLADVPASNGVIHVIDKVLMPPADVVDTSDCAVIIGIDSTGLAFDQPDVSINVGETVCWIWEDESMAHNVAETTADGDNVRKSDGIYSGEAVTTIDFRYTFTEDTTFFYICEPHATMDMRGIITVGNGAVVEEPDPIREPEASTVPGFGTVLVIISLLGALIVFRNSPRER